MTALLLTPDNLKFAKTRLKSAVVGVKSAHLTEALASACRFRTHAALLAALASHTHNRPALAKLDLGRLKERLISLGYSACEFANGRIVEGDALPDPIWFAFRRGDDTANDAWLRQCRTRNIPNIYAHIGSRYWSLAWDCISTDKSYDARVRGQSGDRLTQTMFDQFQRRTRPDSGRPIFDGSAFVGKVERLTPDIARDLADDFFALLYEDKSPRG